jgi:hypothetical protein
VRVPENIHVFAAYKLVKISARGTIENINIVAVTSGFSCDAYENCAILGYNAPSSGNILPTFRDNVSVQSTRLKKSGLLDP